jgi:hypothetical protein
MIDSSDESLPEWTDEELAVLRSAKDDAPGARSLPSTLAAVGVSGALASGAAAAKGAAGLGRAGSAMGTAKWGSAIVLTKWVGAVVIGTAVVAGGVAVARHAGQKSAATAAKSTTTSERTAPQTMAVASPAANTMAETPSAAADVQAAPSPSADSEAHEPTASAPGQRAAVHAQPDISREISALDEARDAVRGGRAAEALTMLDRYDATFGRGGSLRVEATALRIEALLRSGRRSSATSLAETFLARHPKSPYAARVKALVFGDSTSQ